MPAIIGNKAISIKANVVKNDIPLLLSRDSMKRANTVMNFCTDKAMMVDEEISLYSTQGGHYCIPLLPRIKCQLSVKEMNNFVLHISKDFMKMSRKEKKVKALKLHQQFAHPTEERLVKLIKESKGFKEDAELIELIREVSAECQICEEFKRPKSRPVVGMPLAR